MLKPGNIYAVDFSINLIGWLAEQLTAGESRDLSRTAVVFPGKRPGFYLKRAISQRIRREFVPPAIFQTTDFVRYLHGLSGRIVAPLSHVDAAWLIYELSAANGLLREEHVSFDRFFPWGVRLSAIFDELDAELVSRERLESVRSQIASLYPGYMNAIWDNISRLRELFAAELRRIGRLTEGVIMREVAENIDQLMDPIRDRFDHIVFAGHFAMRESVKRVVVELMRAGLASMVWHTDSVEWSPFAEIVKETGIEPISVDAGETSPRIELHEVFDVHSEVLTARELLEEHGLRPSARPDEIAVVLPKEDVLMPLVHEAIAPLRTKFNISMGYPFKRTPFYALIKSIFRTQGTRREDGAYHSTDYLDLVLHPYIKNIQVDGDAAPVRIALHRLQDMLLSSGRRFISLEELEGQFGGIEEALTSADYGEMVENVVGVIKEIHNVFLRGFENVSRIRDVVEAIYRAIDMLMTSGPVIKYPLSGEFISALMEELHQLENSMFIDAPLDSPTVFSFMLSRLGGIRVPFEGTPLSGLQILGLLETRGLNFKKVIVLDVNEGILPSVEPEDALMPVPVRRWLGLPDYTHQEEVYKYHFFRLIRGARNVHLIYRVQEEFIRSRFVEEIVWEKELESGTLGALKPNRPASFRVMPPTREPFRVEKDERYFDALNDRTFSATAIDTYMNCPLRFYLKYVLNLKEPDAIQSDIEATTIGTIVHNVLADFYTRAFPNGAIDWDREGLDLLLNEVIDDHFNRNFPEIRGETFILKRLVQIRLERLLRAERSNTPSGVFRLLAIERVFRGELELPSGRRVGLKGIFDRIDLDTQSGTIRIIDYKTGGTKKPVLRNLPEIGEFDRPTLRKVLKSVQLPLYMHLYRLNHDVEWERLNAALYSVKDARLNFLFNESKVEEGGKTFLMENVFLPAIQFLLSEIFDDSVPIVADDSDSSFCNSCPFRLVCRNRGISGVSGVDVRGQAGR